MTFKKKEETEEALVTVRANELYKNGTIPSGVPQWRAGEVRKVPYADYKKMKRDAPTNWEVVSV